MSIITNWSAQRSGAAITITGKREGMPFKLTCVVTIQPEDSGKLFAYTSGGIPHELAIGGAA